MHPRPPGRAPRWFGATLLLPVWVAGSALRWIDPRTLSAPGTVVATTGALIADGRLQDHLATSAGTEEGAVMATDTGRLTLDPPRTGPAVEVRVDLPRSLADPEFARIRTALLTDLGITDTEGAHAE